MKLHITIDNAEKEYETIMSLVTKLKDIENIEEIGGSISTEKTDIYLNVEK